MKINTTKFLQGSAIIIAATLFSLPMSASAATIYAQASRSTISVGDTAIVTVKIDSGGEVLNTVAGTIGFTTTSTKPIIAVEQFSLGNSAFGLWPLTPSLSKDGNSVTFVGGVPGGFSIEGATLFNIVIQATSTGSVTISPKNVSIYENDGKGTTAPVQFKDITIKVVPAKSGVPAINDWQSLKGADTTPPKPFIIVLGQDPSIFKGQKFAFFSAVDTQSGIDRYEVSENGGKYVRTGSTYVLQNQNGPVNLSVVAYDKAGNTAIANYGTPTIVASKVGDDNLAISIAIAAGIVVIFAIAMLLHHGVRKALKKKSHKK